MVSSETWIYPSNTSFAASVDYNQTECSSSDLALGQGGAISYDLTQPGANTITVEAVAFASADSLLDTSSLDRSATLRMFLWIEVHSQAPLAQIRRRRPERASAGVGFERRGMFRPRRPRVIFPWQWWYRKREAWLTDDISSDNIATFIHSLSRG